LAAAGREIHIVLPARQLRWRHNFPHHLGRQAQDNYLHRLQIEDAQDDCADGLKTGSSEAQNSFAAGSPAQGGLLVGAS
jgi:hypothetical protein